MKDKYIILAWLLLLMTSPAAMAEEGDKGSSSHALKALEYGSKAVVHGSVALVGGVAMSGKAVSAVANEDFKKPLPISDVSVTAGGAPDVAMQGE